MTASTAHGDEDFVTAALQGLSGTAIAEAPEVEPMLNVLGDDSSSFEGKDSGGGDASLPNDAEVGSLDHRSMKVPMVEESEDEPEHEPPPTQPLNPTPLIGSWREEDIEMDVTKTTLFLGRCFLGSFWFYFVFSLLCLLLKFLVFTFS